MSRKNLWGILWRSENILDGKQEFLIHDGRVPLIFTTRREARQYIKESYSHIVKRSYLHAEPFGWKAPIPVRVSVTVTWRK